MGNLTTRYRSKKHDIGVQYLINGGKAAVSQPDDSEDIRFPNIDMSSCNIELVQEDASYDYLMGFRDGVLQFVKYHEQINK